MKERLYKAPIIIGSAPFYLKSLRSLFLRIPMTEPDWKSKEIGLAIFSLFKSNWKKPKNSLEKKLSRKFKVRYVVLTSSGRASIKASLIALGIRGASVILPSFCCYSVLEAVLSAGCYPQFVEVDDNLNIDPVDVKRKINNKTKAILVPHLFGKSAQILKLKKIAQKNNLFLIDDAAQSIGVRNNEKFLGTFGDMGILSFGPFKSLSGIGGGAVLTDNSDTFEKIKEFFKKREKTDDRLKPIKILLKSKFRKFSFFFFILVRSLKHVKAKKTQSFDCASVIPQKMSFLEENFLLNQIDRLDKVIEKRSYLGRQFFKRVCSMKIIKPAFNSIESHGFLKFVIKIDIDRDKEDYKLTESLLKHLLKRGIEAEPVYVPLHIRTNSPQRLLNTEKLYSKLLCLPINSSMKERDLNYMLNSLKEFEEKYVS